MNALKIRKYTTATAVLLQQVSPFPQNYHPCGVVLVLHDDDVLTSFWSVMAIEANCNAPCGDVDADLPRAGLTQDVLIPNSESRELGGSDGSASECQVLSQPYVLAGGRFHVL